MRMRPLAVQIDGLVGLRPSGDRIHLYRNHTVLSTGLDGWIRGAEQGLFVHEARVLSEYRYLINQDELKPAAVSAVTARDSLGHYAARWLPDLVVRDLQVGGARVTLRFVRTRSGEPSCHILKKTGDVHVVRQASPWSLSETLAHRARDLVASALPVH